MNAFLLQALFREWFNLQTNFDEHLNVLCKGTEYEFPASIIIEDLRRYNHTKLRQNVQRPEENVIQTQ